MSDSAPLLQRQVAHTTLRAMQNPDSALWTQGCISSRPPTVKAEAYLPIKGELLLKVMGGITVRYVPTINRQENAKYQRLCSKPTLQVYISPCSDQTKPRARMQFSRSHLLSLRVKY